MMQMLFICGIWGKILPLVILQFVAKKSILYMNFLSFQEGCHDWINWLIHEQNIEIQSAFHGGEKKIGPYKVNGFCLELNTVFKFYGER